MTSEHEELISFFSCVTFNLGFMNNVTMWFRVRLPRLTTFQKRFYFFLSFLFSSLSCQMMMLFTHFNNFASSRHVFDKWIFVNKLFTAVLTFVGHVGSGHVFLKFFFCFASFGAVWAGVGPVAVTGSVMTSRIWKMIPGRGVVAGLWCRVIVAWTVIGLKK